MESNRQRKVAQIIQEDFAELFRKQAAESKQSILVSVSDVKVTADLYCEDLFKHLPSGIPYSSNEGD